MSKASQDAILGKPHSQRGSSDRPTQTEVTIGKPTKDGSKNFRGGYIERRK